MMKRKLVILSIMCFGLLALAWAGNGEGDKKKGSVPVKKSTVSKTKKTTQPTVKTILRDTVMASGKLDPNAGLSELFEASSLTSTTGGCDTIRTLTLTVNPLLTVTRTLAICANQLPFTWNGHVFNAAGIIIDTARSTTGGCDTIRTLTLTVDPLLAVTRTLAICANQLPFNWNGHVFNAATTITDTVASTTGGCDTIRTLTLTINPLLSVTRTLKIVVNRIRVDLDGRLIIK